MEENRARCERKPLSRLGPDLRKNLAPGRAGAGGKHVTL